MMKKIMLIALSVLMVCTLTGCGGQKEAAVDSTADVALKELVARHITKAGVMIEMPETDLEDYIGIEPSMYKEAVYLQEGTLDGDEVLVIRAVDSKAADSVVSCMENYLAQRLKETQNYLPEAYKVLKATGVQRKHNTVALIVMEKATDVTAALLAGE